MCPYISTISKQIKRALPQNQSKPPTYKHILYLIQRCNFECTRCNSGEVALIDREREVVVANAGGPLLFNLSPAVEFPRTSVKRVFFLNVGSKRVHCTASSLVEELATKKPVNKTCGQSQNEFTTRISHNEMKHHEIKVWVTRKLTYGEETSSHGRQEYLYEACTTNTIELLKFPWIFMSCWWQTKGTQKLFWQCCLISKINAMHNKS